jgi:hypothetical protein
VTSSGPLLFQLQVRTPVLGRVTLKSVLEYLRTRLLGIEKRRMPKVAADSSESVDIKVLTVRGSVWEL